MNTTTGTTVEPAPAGTVQELTAQRERYENAIQQMEKHLRKGPDGKFQLTAKSAAEVGIDADLFTHLSNSLQSANQKIDRGELKAEEVGFSSQTRLPAARPATACAGRNLMLHYWWGVKIFVDECVTQSIESDLALAVGGTAIATTIAAALGVTAAAALPIGLVAGILGLAQRGIQAIDVMGSNHGVVFNVTWIAAFWIWHQ